VEGALAWIGKIAEWIGKWIPRWVVLDTTEGAIKYVGGKNIKVCEAGIHFYWPARTKFQEYPTAEQTDRLESQTMESRDGKTFIVSGTLTYSVSDLRMLVPVTHSPSTAVIDKAMTAMHDVCCQFDWAALQEEQRKGTLKTKLRNAAQKELDYLGVEVLMLKLNTLARCRVLKISQSSSMEEN
jgi:regulator of protease activity HflC (stomatin/prohibitin superfamily)